LSELICISQESSPEPWYEGGRFIINSKK